MERTDSLPRPETASLVKSVSQLIVFFLKKKLTNSIFSSQIMNRPASPARRAWFHEAAEPGCMRTTMEGTERCGARSQARCPYILSSTSSRDYNNNGIGMHGGLVSGSADDPIDSDATTRSTAMPDACIMHGLSSPRALARLVSVCHSEVRTGTHARRTSRR